MNISIEDFTQADFEDYLAYAIDSYAASHVKSGNWTEEEAKSRSKKQFDSLLKDGLKSEGHVFWKANLDGKKIGLFWFHRNPKDLKSIFVYDTRIDDEHQSKGIGTYAFSIIRERLKALDISKIRLHVFAHNSRAVKLYERLGFQFTSYNMHYLIDD